MNPVNFFLLAICAVLAAADHEGSGYEGSGYEGSGYEVSGLLTNSENELVTRIVGGEDAEEGQFPYQISLRTVLQRAHFCGGSILSKRFLLTAAHCTQGAYAQPRNIYAVVGALRRLSGGIVVKLDKITAHESYDPYKILNDVSLLRAAQDITFTDTIQPIALPSADLPEAGDTPVLLSGWGRTSYPTPIGKPQLPDILQFTHPRTLSTTNCKRLFKGIPAASNVHESNLCTINAKNVGACMGDSGIFFIELPF